MIHLPLPSTEENQILSDISRHGIAFQEDFLSPGQLAALRERVLEQAELEIEQGVAEISVTGNASDRDFTGEDCDEARFQSVSFLPNKGQVFRDLMCDPRILAYCRHAFAEVPFYLASQSATIVRKGASGQVIHADQQAWPFVTPLPVMFNFAVALTDFTPDMGSTRFVPGTKDGPPPRIDLDLATGVVGNVDPVESVPCSLRAGSLAMWEGRVWHGQGASISSQDRVAVIMTFVMHMVRAQDNYAALLHDDVYAGLTDQEKRLLGFEVHFDYAGRIAPRHSVDPHRNTNYVFPYVPELRRGSDARAVPRTGMRIAHAEVQAEIV